MSPTANFLSTGREKSVWTSKSSLPLPQLPCSRSLSAPLNAQISFTAGAWRSLPRGNSFPFAQGMYSEEVSLSWLFMHARGHWKDFFLWGCKSMKFFLLSISRVSWQKKKAVGLFCWRFCGQSDQGGCACFLNFLFRKDRDRNTVFPVFFRVQLFF